jgi:hypothetical protein
VLPAKVGVWRAAVVAVAAGLVLAGCGSLPPVAGTSVHMAVGHVPAVSLRTVAAPSRRCKKVDFGMLRVWVPR